jgi:hypothetical protein
MSRQVLSLWQSHVDLGSFPATDAALGELRAMLYKQAWPSIPTPHPTAAG